MNKSKRFYNFLFVTIILIFAGARAEGQYIPYSVSASTSSLLVSNVVTFSLNLTNNSGQNLSDLVVTDSLPSSVNINSYSAGGAGFTQVSNNVGVFSLVSFLNGEIFQASLSVIPTQTGLFTNTVTITTASDITNETTNLVINVTNLVILANLGVSLIAPVQTVIVGDSVPYTITLTNAGPDTAPDVLLTNTLPPGVIVESASPTNQSTVGTTNLIFNLGPLASGSTDMVSLVVEPTNAGSLAFSAAVGSAGITNVSRLSTQATTNLTVLNIVTNALTAMTNSGQSLDLQNGLEEQSVLLKNITTNPVAAARVVVSGLTRQLYNAVGSNSGNPYVVYTAPSATPLAPGQSVSLLLQYNPRGSFTFTNGQLQAYPVPPPNLTPPGAIATSTNLNFSGIFNLPNGNILVEFPASTNRTYTVVYSDNVLFSNAMIAPPAITPSANFIQWIDYGPPATVVAPAATSARFYRVLENP